MNSRSPALDALGSGWASARRCAGLRKGRRLDPSAERVLFALAANPALAPTPRLATARRGERGRARTGLGSVSDDACYRAMDWLLRSARAAGTRTALLADT